MSDPGITEGRDKRLGKESVAEAVAQADLYGCIVPGIPGLLYEGPGEGVLELEVDAEGVRDEISGLQGPGEVEVVEPEVFIVKDGGCVGPDMASEQDSGFRTGHYSEIAVPDRPVL